MSAEEFWDLTAEEFEARYEVWREQEKRWDLRFGVVASGYINTKLKPGYPPVEPGAWFGHTSEDDDREMTPEETVTFMKQLVSAHNAQMPS